MVVVVVALGADGSYGNVVLGSSIICIDLVTRHIPRWKHFSIRENSTFLSASLSLSFGVMVCRAKQLRAPPFVEQDTDYMWV